MSEIQLVDVYQYYTASTLRFLYELLKEREPIASISHREIPSFEDHVRFIESNPYLAWYLVQSKYGISIGSIYLTERREIGIFIKKGWQHGGYGQAAVRELIRLHPGGPFYANINPKNDRSIRFFEQLGFGLKQLTLSLEAAD